MVKPYQPPAETAWPAAPAAKRAPVWQTLLAAFVVVPGLAALAGVFLGLTAAVAVATYKIVSGH
jgi:hypothetical protein